MIFLFWFCTIAILYTYVGYPAGIWLLARLRRLKTARAPITPSVSVVLACHNEEANIAARLRNLAESDYPAGLLEIVVVSDGSNDRTVELANNCDLEHVRVVGYARLMGKAAALNIGVKIARGDVIVFADARQRFEPQAIRELVANLADPSVGAVSGQLQLGGADGSAIGEGAGRYWRYETWIRRSEADFDSCIGAVGAIYAIRRELWRTLPAGVILDDVYTPMQIALAGYRVVYEEKARAYDHVSATAGREFSRKVRTLLGNYQLCQSMPGLLSPSHRLFVQFFSHKLLRLAAPVLMLVLLASNAVIAASSVGAPETLVYVAVLIAQIGFYLVVAIGWALSGRNSRLPLVNIAYVFSLMNAAAIVGLLYFIVGKRDVWARSE
ncbi:MAG TPA: glycosyltransferase family 2 protein [Blastocatellia bacterium]|jgi:biofilm PGA synthesis N-glycosyltransferase PgaC|nr:glycosyltransferase family 2 protein [Blastocatellia bacterium]